MILLGDGRKQSRRPNWMIRLAIFGLAMSMSRTAMAQDQQVLTPIQMFEPEASPGVQIAPGVVARPLVVEGVTYDSNIYNIEHGGRSDEVFQLRPRLVVGTNLARHYLELSGGADIRRYAKFKDENSEAADVRARALFELGGWVNVEPEAGIARGVEQRGTAGDQFFTDRPVTYTRKYTQLDISRGQHKLEVALHGGISTTGYNDATVAGNPVDLSNRDFTTRNGSLQLALNLGSRLKLYTRAGGNQLAYRTVASKFRNSSGYAVMGGLMFEITRLIDVDAGLGYIHQSFKSGAYQPVNAIDYHLVANWTPQPSWLVSATAQRAFDGSPLANVAAIFRTTFRLEAKHAPSDRVLIGVSASHTNEAYRGIDRTDRRFQADLAVHYRLTPNIGVVAGAGYRKQGGGNSGRRYEGAAVSLALRVIA